MKKLYFLTVIIIAFLSGIMTTCFATHDASFERSLESRKNYEAACIYKYIIMQHLENYRDLDELFPDDDWGMHANNLEELYDEVIDNVDGDGKHIITSKELYTKYNK